MKFTPILFALALPALLAGCDSRLDYHGIDPRAYNEVLNPKENTVEFNSVYQSFTLTHDAQFTPESAAEFKHFTNRVYPSAVERLVIASAYPDEARNLYVTRQLRALGFKKKIMEYHTDPALAPEEMVVQFDYYFVTPPDCPDWRKASDTNYSNTNMTQMQCASATNLGAQIANPKHLLDSDELRVAPEGAIGANAIVNYRTPTPPPAPVTATGGTDTPAP